MKWGKFLTVSAETEWRLQQQLEEETLLQTEGTAI